MRSLFVSFPPYPFTTIAGFDCVRMRGIPAHSLRAVLSLVEKKLGSCALRRAAAWTAVLPGPAQDHHGHEDPAGRVGRREDQMQDDPGKLRHRQRREPRGGNEVCIKCTNCCLLFQYCINIYC